MRFSKIIILNENKCISCVEQVELAEGKILLKIKQNKLENLNL